MTNRPASNDPSDLQGPSDIGGLLELAWGDKLDQRVCVRYRLQSVGSICDQLDQLRDCPGDFFYRVLGFCRFLFQCQAFRHCIRWRCSSGIEMNYLQRTTWPLSLQAHVPTFLHDSSQLILISICTVPASFTRVSKAPV